MEEKELFSSQSLPLRFSPVYWILLKTIHSAFLLFVSGFGLGGSLTLSIAYLPDVIDKSLDKYMCYFESFWGATSIPMKEKISMETENRFLRV